jgi:hypothetical protein
MMDNRLCLVRCTSARWISHISMQGVSIIEIASSLARCRGSCLHVTHFFRRVDFSCNFSHISFFIHTFPWLTCHINSKKNVRSHTNMWEDVHAHTRLCCGTDAEWPTESRHSKNWCQVLNFILNSYLTNEKVESWPVIQTKMAGRVKSPGWISHVRESHVRAKYCSHTSSQKDMCVFSCEPERKDCA